MNFQFSKAVRKFVDTTGGLPQFKVSSTQNKFQLNAAAMNKLGAVKGSYISILHNPEAENINEAFALTLVSEPSITSATIGTPPNSHRGEFSFSGKYGMLIAMDTQIDYTPDELVTMGIFTKIERTDDDGKALSPRYVANRVVTAEIGDGIEMEVDGEVFMIYPLVNFKTADKIIREKSTNDEGDDDDDMFVDTNEEEA